MDAAMVMRNEFAHELAYIESESGEQHTQNFHTMGVSNLRTGVPMDRYDPYLGLSVPARILREESDRILD